MNTVWSTYVQKTGTLYQSRTLRFSDIYKESYRSIFNIEDRGSILEIGCGPGALTQALHRWYPHAQVIGTDLDHQFLEFASRQAPGLQFMHADATCLPYENDTYNVTISNTVQEHVEPSKFYGEQYRVLKNGGVCLILSARRGVNIPAPCIASQTKLENEIYSRTEKFYAKADEKFKVCAYPKNESELPAEMEKYGFRNVSVQYMAINLTPDDPMYTKEQAYAMINANRQTELDAVDLLTDIAIDAVSDAEIAELKKIKNAKYDERIRLYNSGIKQWDVSLSLTMIIRGVK